MAFSINLISLLFDIAYNKHHVGKINIVVCENGTMSILTMVAVVAAVT